MNAIVRVRAPAATLLAATLLAATPLAHAEVRITELMFEGAGVNTVEYKSNGTLNYKVADDKREFFEFTNLGSAAVDLTGWGYNDDNVNDPVAFGSAFGTLAAGESAVLTEMAADDFRTLWGLSASVKVFSIGGSSNLGKNDTINLYDAAGALVDSVTFPKGLDASGGSYNRPHGDTGNSTDTWVRSVVGDVYGSALSGDVPLVAYNIVGNDGVTLVSVMETAARHDLANPGIHAPVPEPSALALMLAGLGGIALAVRRRR